jgi:hypothetical protein
VSDISKLTGADEFTASMQIPVYDSENGQPRRVSGQQLVEYMQANPAPVTEPVGLPVFSVSELSTMLPASYAYKAVYCSDGNTGAACLAVSDGTAWRRIAFGTAVASS